MRVLVTGSSGFIGSVLSKMLSEEKGILVFKCDTQPDIPTFRQTSFLKMSFDDDIVVKTIIDNDIQVIFHLAATSLVGPSFEDPLTYYWNNAARTTNFLHKLRLAGWKGHIIFSSTAAVYAEQNVPVNESDNLEPINHYGISKLRCEEMIECAWKYGMSATVFRYFNVAGAYEECGEEAGDTHLISRLCSATYDNGTFLVYGVDYPTDDGSCVRDYIHVRDVCAAQIYAWKRKVYGTFNLGTHRGTSVIEMIDAFKNVTNTPIDWTFVDRRIGDPAYLVADPKYFKASGFVYQHSDIYNIIESSWNHYKMMREKDNGI